MVASVVSPGYDAEQTFQAALDLTKTLQSVKLPFYTNTDVIKYEIMVMDPSGVKPLCSGEIPASDYHPIVIDFSTVGKKKYTFVWSGQSPEDADLTELKVELKNANGMILKTISYKGSSVPAPAEYLTDDADEVYMDITRSFANGQTEKEEGVRINPGETVIKP